MELFEYEREHSSFVRSNSAECTVLLKKDGSFPLKEAGKIALYGSGGRRTIMGGTGSGEVNSRYQVTAEEGLKNAGFTVTSSSWLDGYEQAKQQAKEQFIRDLKVEAKQRRQNVMLLAMGRTPNEPDYDLTLNGDGDTAVYVLSRVSGEGADRTPAGGDILLSDTEIRDILACNQKYQNFMLVLNTGGPVDLTPVMEVRNILVLSQLGAETGNILADILLGKQIPSGKLTTTWAAWENYPTLWEFGEKDDTRYQEGIYVGYRYFDSAKVKEEEENLACVGDTVWEKLVKDCEVNSYPKGSREQAYKDQKRSFRVFAKASGQTYQEFIGGLGYEDSDVRSMGDDCVRDRMIAKTIAKKEGLEMSDTEYEKYLLAFLEPEEAKDKTLKAMEKRYREEQSCYPRDDMLINLVKEYVGEHAKVKKAS